MDYVWTSPTSLTRLREYANNMRRVFNCANELYFPVIDILDDLMDRNAIGLVVIEDDSDFFPDCNELARYNLGDNTIYVRESVYREALEDIGRSRFTLTHELCHYILLKVLNFEVYQMNVIPPAFQDPEWQANALAAELLVPFEQTKNYSVEEIMNTCKVSEECAIVQYAKRKKG